MFSLKRFFKIKNRVDSLLEPLLISKALRQRNKIYNLLNNLHDKNGTKPKMPHYKEYEGTAEFEALWEVMKGWDIGAKEYYSGHTGCMGNHIMIVLKALSKENVERVRFNMESKKIEAKDW